MTGSDLCINILCGVIFQLCKLCFLRFICWGPLVKIAPFY